MLFDVLDEKVAKVLHRTDVVAQVVADNHVRLRDDAMVFVDAEALEVGVQFPPLATRHAPFLLRQLAHFASFGASRGHVPSFLAASLRFIGAKRPFAPRGHLRARPSSARSE
jgi:hypothetical protein